MRKERSVLFIALAFVFACMATIAVYYYMKHYENNIMAEGGLTEIVIVATVDVKPGTQLQEYMLQSVQWPKNKMLSQHCFDKKELIKKVAKTAIPKGMPILKSFLAKKGDNLSHFVQDKKRAMTISFKNKYNRPSLLMPGNYVDILATFERSGQTPFSKTILQHVYVIAVNGKTLETYSADKKTKVEDVTVSVSPRDAEMLALAKTQATLQFVLRNMNDTDELKSDGINVQSLLFGNVSASKTENNSRRKIDSIVNKLPLKSKTVKIIRGSAVQEIRVN